MGVDRYPQCFPKIKSSCPRARGGGPSLTSASRVAIVLSPRSWGWTVYRSSHHVVNPVVPTLVGVDRTASRCSRTRSSCPHARGGGPDKPELKKRPCVCPRARGGGPFDTIQDGASLLLSPRSWGWTVFAGRSYSSSHVVPTLVGVDRQRPGPVPARPGCPTLVGVDLQAWIEDASVTLSPRSWGWTGWSASRDAINLVVPTLVGVGRKEGPTDAECPCCPHARGVARKSTCTCPGC